MQSGRCLIFYHCQRCTNARLVWVAQEPYAEVGVLADVRDVLLTHHSAAEDSNANDVIV